MGKRMWKQSKPNARFLSPRTCDMGRGTADVPTRQPAEASCNAGLQAPQKPPPLAPSPPGGFEALGKLREDLGWASPRRGPCRCYSLEGALLLGGSQCHGLSWVLQAWGPGLPLHLNPQAVSPAWGAAATSPPARTQTPRVQPPAEGRRSPSHIPLQLPSLQTHRGEAQMLSSQLEH